MTAELMAGRHALSGHFFAHQERFFAVKLPQHSQAAKTPPWPFWLLFAGIAEHGRSAEMSLQMLIV